MIRFSHIISFFRAFTGTFVLLAALAAGQAIAVPADFGLGQKTMATDTPWTLRANQLISRQDGLVVEAVGNVLLVRGSDTLKADFARYYTATGWVLLQKNVFVHLDGDEVRAEEAEFDLNSSTGWIKDAKIFLAGPHLHFSGSEATKHDSSNYTFKNARVTACDGEKPIWSFEAENADLTVDGYIRMNSTNFNLADIPVVYSPYLVLPAKVSRQTGLLKPDFGQSSRHGFFVTLPWYWAIDQSRDMTVSLTAMTKKGFMPSIEYRSHTQPDEQLWFAADMLYDGDIDTVSRIKRTNHLRYWFRGMGDGSIGNSLWHYRYNIDYASDNTFLDEYRYRMTGFEYTNAATSKLFGRTLARRTRNRISEGFAYRDYGRWYATVGARYENNLSIGHGNASRDTDTTVQKFPEINLFMKKDRLAEWLPFEVQASATGAYMFRRLGNKGMRGDVNPSLALPVDLRYATLIAEAGVSSTLYSTQGIQKGRRNNAFRA